MSDPWCHYYEQVAWPGDPCPDHGECIGPECDEYDDDEATPKADPAGVCEWMSEDDPMKYR